VLFRDIYEVNYDLDGFQASELQMFNQFVFSTYEVTLLKPVNVEVLWRTLALAGKHVETLGALWDRFEDGSFWRCLPSDSDLMNEGTKIDAIFSPHE
jgi:hypothetical protein